MALADDYRKQVALLIRTVPFIAPENQGHGDQSVRARPAAALGRYRSDLRGCTSAP
jgi:hypothetical protein